MKKPVLFIGAVTTLLHSWGSDTPPEVVWGLNEMLDWYSEEYGVPIKSRFTEPYDDPYDGECNVKAVMEDLGLLDAYEEYYRLLKEENDKAREDRRRKNEHT